VGRVRNFMRIVVHRLRYLKIRKEIKRLEEEKRE
jgi:hypothetical protein